MRALALCFTVAYVASRDAPLVGELPGVGLVRVRPTAWASVAPAAALPGSTRGLTRDVPKSPLTGQKRPPCNHRGAVVINGGCWMGGEKPPCEKDDYQYEGRCYAALFIMPERVPTS